MNAASVTEFAKLAASTIKATYGSSVLFGATSYTAVVSTGSPELNLESGGFQRPVDFVVRVSKVDMPTAPAIKSAVTIDSKIYRVLSVRLNYSPLAQEWIVEVGNP
jgi:hypothetical protein